MAGRTPTSPVGPPGSCVDVEGWWSLGGAAGLARGQVEPRSGWAVAAIASHSFRPLDRFRAKRGVAPHTPREEGDGQWGRSPTSQGVPMSPQPPLVGTIARCCPSTNPSLPSGRARGPHNGETPMAMGEPQMNPSHPTILGSPRCSSGLQNPPGPKGGGPSLTRQGRPASRGASTLRIGPAMEPASLAHGAKGTPAPALSWFWWFVSTLAGRRNQRGSRPAIHAGRQWGATNPEEAIAWVGRTMGKPELLEGSSGLAEGALTALWVVMSLAGSCQGLGCGGDPPSPTGGLGRVPFPARRIAMRETAAPPNGRPDTHIACGPARILC